MMIKNILVAAIAVSFAATPVLAQTSSNPKKEENGHHYSGGPKTEVPSSHGKERFDGENGGGTSTGGHHYSGGPRAKPHHMGEKKQ